METPTRFDLNEALRQWRDGMAGSPALGTDPLDELEAHLRDSIKALTAKGLSPEEAFWLARRRLGSEAALGGEYAKVNREAVWLDRVLWMVAGWVIIKVVSTTASVAANVAMAGAIQLALPKAALGFLHTAVHWAAFAGLIAWLWHALRNDHEVVRRVGRWMQTYPFGTGLLLVGVSVASGVMQMFPNLFLARTLTPSVVGYVFYWSSASSLVLTLLFWPCVVTWLLVRLPRKEAAR
jgi:hypothetical protein